MVNATTGPRHPTITVPHVGEMAEGQLRGHLCVWCGQGLRPDASVDLGPRIGEDDHRWYPRSCPACAVPQLHGQLVEHTGSCEQCADEPRLCTVWESLQSALREGRRIIARARTDRS
ncbi:hypothetical protein [Streptomyces sp. NPDC088785]|uniref:hypothetical protein n=1 Tax=Streptomyces sp. NPDC088785 TaxID=3365897 RepID=UPI00381B93B3